MKSRCLMLLVMLPLLAACQDVYHPLKGGIGFSEVPTGADSFQISYQGDSNMSVTEARRFAMLRASELAVLQNKTHFQIQGEQIFVGTGTRVWPGSDSSWVETYRDRRGMTRAFIHHSYSPGYVETYTVPDVEMQVRLTSDGAPPSIPAGYLLRQAVGDKIKLSPGVAERVAALPQESGPVALPPEPTPATHP